MKIAPALIIFGLASMVVAVPASAQQARTSRDARQAYGSRLDQEAVPAVSRGVTQRLSSRIENRIGSRLSTRVERYNVLDEPTAALRRSNDDRSRSSTIVQAPLPPPDQ